MIRKVVAAGLVTLSVAATGLIGPGGTPSARQAIAARYADYDRAVLKGMPALVKWCRANFAPDFTVTSADGNRMTGKQFIGMCETMARKPDPTWKGVKKQKATIDELVMEGKNAVVSVTSEGTYRTTDTAGLYGAKGADHELTMVQHYRETWRRVGSVWKVSKSVGLKGGATLVDGKPAPGAKQGGG